MKGYQDVAKDEGQRVIWGLGGDLPIPQGDLDQEPLIEARASWG